MARKPKKVKFDGTIHWFSIAFAASELGTTQQKLAARGLDGELQYEPDKFGMPAWFQEPEIAALKKARGETLEAKSAKRSPRAKTAKQQEAEWAKMSAAHAQTPRDGPFLALHLRLTLPLEDPKKPEKG